MGILTKEIILKEIKNGNIVIEPFYPDQIGPASVDLHLGNHFRIFEKLNRVFHIEEESNVETVTDPIEVKDGESLLLKPGETVLGVTREKITLSSAIAGWLEGRSRFARLGLGVHITSGFLQPGIANYQVLEITNLGPTSFELSPGLRICQVVFERCEGKAKYEGKFKNQSTP